MWYARRNDQYISFIEIIYMIVRMDLIWILDTDNDLNSVMAVKRVAFLLIVVPYSDVRRRTVGNELLVVSDHTTRILFGRLTILFGNILFIYIIILHMKPPLHVVLILTLNGT